MLLDNIASSLFRRGVHARASGDARNEDTRSLLVSYVLIDGPRKDPIKRETARSPCYSKNYYCGNITSKVKTYVL